MKKIQNNICTVEQLKKYIELTPNKEKKLEKIVQKHPMCVTPYYMSLIDWEDPNDPIRKMAIPSIEELNLEGSYDTSGEAENTKMPGLQHKYSETSLILATNKCAMYCRHCFRKRLVGLKTKEIIERFEDSATYIRQHEEINNVLVTGGDPLVLENEVIEKLLLILSDIPQIKFIRFGSRAPVTFPSRFEDKKLLKILSKYCHLNRRIYVVTQFNHPQEITKQAIKAVDNLLKAGVIVNNQTVLLKGVNDNPVTLTKLLNKLVSIGVVPYYLFQCRPVKGVKGNFQVALTKAIKIVEETKKHCNGLSKRFRYIMSHRTGKIEIIGIFDNEIFFKYHQAKNRNKIGKIFKRPIKEEACWLDELKMPIEENDFAPYLL
ncbi:MAG: KamA family radical SAM protein [Candidatus Bathyarchaeota archaeon]|nr:KamA family radical SAM protein [Candidatus Bathyarchaeum tardum]WGM89002.1 MAG: KamA family radical SAM protein [Candidatus Bathyarchaeum tardum]WNZ28761.1 MAG: KamA family radical SAM protein [Candidatus Bathyarchaeota archaeon]